jgi:hypothetical protein
MDAVREAFNSQESAQRKAMRSAAPYVDVPYSYRYVKEVWSDFLLVCDESGGKYSGLVKIPYTVNSKGEISFGKEVQVRAEYVEMAGKPLWSNPHGPAVMRLSNRLEN